MTTFEPRGTIAVDKRGGRLLSLDAETLAVRSEIADMPTLQHELAISPGRAFAYVPAYGDGAHGDNPHPNHGLSVIDLHRRERLCDIDLSPLEASHMLRFGPDGNLYVACDNSAAAAVIDGRSDRLIDLDTRDQRTVEVGVKPMDGGFHPDDGPVATCVTGYDGHKLARLINSLQHGWIDMENAFDYKGRRLRVVRRVGDVETITETVIAEQHPFMIEVDAFADCISSDTKPSASGEDGVQDHRLTEAIYQAAQAGCVVSV